MKFEDVASSKGTLSWPVFVESAESLGLRGASRETLKQCWQAVDTDTSGSLDKQQFDELVAKVKEKQAAYPVTKATAVGAAVGMMAGGPVGAFIGGAVGTMYANMSTTTVAGGVAGGILAGPPGAVVGAGAAVLGNSAADNSYIGCPRKWKKYDQLRDGGKRERRDGYGDCVANSPRKGGLAVCGSGGGLRAATAFMAFLAEMEDLGLMDETAYIAGLSGSAWSLAAWYAEDIDGEGPSASEFLEKWGERLKRDVRGPDPTWYRGEPSGWVFERFAARADRGLDISIADIWGAHLAHNFLQEKFRKGGFGVAGLKPRLGERPTPIFTAVEARRNGPVWTRDAAKCERCQASFGKIVGRSRHHCRACGRAVCEPCAPNGKVLRRCNVCIKAGIAAPVERTKWVWWEFTPDHVKVVGSSDQVCASNAFGGDGGDVGPSGGEPLGQLLGVFGSAFCATVERFEGAGSIGQRTAALARHLADPGCSDPSKPVLEPAAFHHPFREGLVYLGDAGFASNLPLTPLLDRPEVDVVVVFDASAYDVKVNNGISEIIVEPLRRELQRDAVSAASVGAQLHFDVEAYASKPVSFHTATIKDRTVLVVAFHLAKLDQDDCFCPLLSAKTGGFCNNATASYADADFRKLVTFVRTKLRRHVGDILKHIHDHRATGAGVTAEALGVTTSTEDEENIDPRVGNSVSPRTPPNFPPALSAHF